MTGEHSIELSLPERFTLGQVKRKLQYPGDEAEISIHSLASSSSSSLASGMSLIPFFILNPPRLPHLDEHTKDDAMQHSNLNVQKKRGNLAHARKQDRIEGVSAVNMDTASFLRKDLFSPIKKIDRERFYRRDDFLLKPQLGDKSVFGTYSIVDMKRLLNYIDSCGNMNGEISLDEFDMAFRKFKHSSLHSEEDDRAKALLGTVLKVLHLDNSTPGSWFQSCWSGDLLKDPTTQSWPEFRDNLNALFRNNFVEEIVNRDFLTLQRFMDPMAEFDSSNELSESEFISAFKRLSMPESTTEQMSSAKVLLEHIDTYITIKRLRIRDLFNLWGKGKSLDLSQLSKGLEKILNELDIKKTVGILKEASTEKNEIKGRHVKSWNSPFLRKRKCRVDRVPPLPRRFMKKTWRENVKSSGYGYGVIKRPIQIEKVIEDRVKDLSNRMETVQIFEMSPTDGKALRMIEDIPSIVHQTAEHPSEKRLEFLVQKRSKERYLSKLTHLDDQLKCSMQKAFRDLSVRPGNISCGVDGGYMKVT